MDLRYCLQGAHYAGVNKHPEKVLRDLGIEFETWKGQSMGEQIWLGNCTNVPEELPSYITEMVINPTCVSSDHKCDRDTRDWESIHIEGWDESSPYSVKIKVKRA